MTARQSVETGRRGLALLLVLGVVAPYITADQYGERLKGSLERALGRRVDLKAKVRFSLLHGPAFRVDGNGGSGVVIHEDPALGIEPIAYVGALEVRPSLWHLLFGSFVIASIRLEDASINLTKSGPASEWGRWNFTSIVNPAVMRELPAIHVRNGRINFKFGDDKSVFYLTETDLDISPPGRHRQRLGGGLSAKPRAPTAPLIGLGSSPSRDAGTWRRSASICDLELADTGLDELTALMRGQSGGIHGDRDFALPSRRTRQPHRHQGRLNNRRHPPLGPAAHQEPRAGPSTFAANSIRRRRCWSCNRIPRATFRCRSPCASAPPITSRGRIGPWL